MCSLFKPRIPQNKLLEVLPLFFAALVYNATDEEDRLSSVLDLLFILRFNTGSPFLNPNTYGLNAELYLRF